MKRKKIWETGKIGQQVRTIIVFARTLVQFPALTLCSSQLPKTTCPGNLTPSLLCDKWTNVYTHRHT